MSTLAAAQETLEQKTLRTLSEMLAALHRIEAALTPAAPSKPTTKGKK